MTDIRPQHRRFRFVAADLAGRTLSLRYALEGGPDPDLAFCEQLDLPAGLPPPDPAAPGTRRLIEACHLSFGVSYYKAAMPAEIAAPALDAADAAFWNLLYGAGLGEFRFRNGLPIPAEVGFCSPARDAAVQARAVDDALNETLADPGQRASVQVLHADMPERVLVLIGGGKDSALVAEVVRASGVPAAALAMGTSPWMHRSAAAAGLELHRVARRLDPALLELNRRGAWNGHVPISACIAAVATLVAHAAGFTTVLVGNERGADDANLVWQGQAVNHAWSKSSFFEAAFQAWCRRGEDPLPHYASLLRPLSEISIARAFASCRAQHVNFTSCNRNFALDAASHPARWCGRCAKCVFVALILAPHLEPDVLATVFGTDLLAIPANRAHLTALLGLADVKPWDCVGTPRECWLSLLALERQERLDPALQPLVAQAPPALRGAGFDAAWEEELALGPAPGLPPAWRDRLERHLGTA